MIINLKLVVVAVLALFTFSSCNADPIYALEDDLALDGAVYRGLPSSAQSQLFEYIERYELEVLYSIMFDDRDYLLLEFHDSASGESVPVKGYSFILFNEKVSFSGENSEVINNYIIGLGDASFVKNEDIVDRSINFVIEDGKIRLTGVGINFHPEVVWGVVPSDHQEGYLSIWGSTSTINYASYSTDFDGQIVSRQWLKIKDYASKVGGVSDYEKIVLVAVVAVGGLFISFFKFRS